MELFISGMLAMSCLVAAVFFLKFYRQTHDFLFLMFSVAFMLEAVNRTSLAVIRGQGEAAPTLYLIRLLAYLLLLVGIASKNLHRKN